MSQSPPLALNSAMRSQIEELRTKMMRFSDGELRQFRGVLREGTPGGLNGPGTAQALAVVREAARRFAACSFRDSELAAAVELHSGKAVELPDDGNNDLGIAA
jgi:preprotein translocase subunit SecA